MAKTRRTSSEEPRFDTLLVAVDGSGHADKAVKVAARIAAPLGSRVLILSVYKHYSAFESSHSLVRGREAPSPPDITLRELAREAVERARGHAQAAGVKDVRTFVKRGPPARTIVKFAEERSVDVIVLGSRGLGDIEGFFLGSVSHKVSALSACTTITVK